MTIDRFTAQINEMLRRNETINEPDGWVQIQSSFYRELLAEASKVESLLNALKAAGDEIEKLTAPYYCENAYAGKQFHRAEALARRLPHVTPPRAELSAKWRMEHGDHTECPTCGSQCRDSFLGDDLRPVKKAAENLADALLRIVNECKRFDRPSFEALGQAEAALQKAGLA